ncbi:MAG: TolC family protein [Prevotella sp.]|nr:TolC family protein [Prevotella sp.]
MKHSRLISTAIGLAMAMIATAQTTLNDCQKWAAENYPLLKRYELLQATTDYTVANINKGWLPQLSAGAQATLQSDVMSLPDGLKSIMSQAGYNVKGLKKDQYKVAIDVSQTIYDGGSIKAAKQAARAEGEAKARQNDVDMFAIRDRVNNLFFGILLAEDKLKLNSDLQQLLLDNCRKLEAMVKGGTATNADLDAVKAEYLNARQQQVELSSAKNSYVRMLEIFTGRQIEQPLKRPEAAVPEDISTQRPELSLFNAQTRQLNARSAQLDAAIRPRLSLFAQGYYGYPGYNMFEDMFSHDWSLNGMIGMRLSWNISSLYTHKNEKRKLATAANEIENARDVFLFNNRLQTTQERMAVERYRRIIADDDEIIQLRTSVRQAAEAKLSHGIIDVNGLLQEITRENTARTQQSVHEIEMLKAIYELKDKLGIKN